MSIVQNILDAARWAPSASNSQPWRFEIPDDRHIIVHGAYACSDVYDLDGRLSQTGLGALLESIAIAASVHRLKAEIVRRPTIADQPPSFDIVLADDPAVQPDPLAPWLPLRSTQRRRMSPRVLKPSEKQQIEEAAGFGYRIVWLEAWNIRLRLANLLFRAARMRLNIPEVYEAQKSIIDWDSSYSEERIPDRAIGLDPIATRMLRWTLRSWRRTRFATACLRASLVPRFQLEWLPALWCGAHIVLTSDRPPRTLEDFVAGGRVMQRAWLTAASLGVQLQPEMPPIVFARYIKDRRRFSRVDQAQWDAERMSLELADLLGPATLERTVLLARIGHAQVAAARATRLPLDRLMRTGSK